MHVSFLIATLEPLLYHGGDSRQGQMPKLQFLVKAPAATTDDAN
jgi:hypothetical protein